MKMIMIFYLFLNVILFQQAEQRNILYFERISDLFNYYFYTYVIVLLSNKLNPAINTKEYIHNYLINQKNYIIIKKHLN